MNVECIDHVAIQVVDLEKAVKVFSDVFGMSFTQPKTLPEMDAVSVLESNGIEFIAPHSSDGPAARSIQKRGEGLSLLSLKVTNLDEAIADMEKRGIRLVEKFDSDNKAVKGAIFHPADMFGVMIELVEYEKRHPIHVAGE